MERRAKMGFFRLMVKSTKLEEEVRDAGRKVDRAYEVFNVSEGPKRIGWSTDRVSIQD